MLAAEELCVEHHRATGLPVTMLRVFNVYGPRQRAEMLVPTIVAGIRAGVRRTIDERGPWREEQAVTVEQALHATCVAPAWLCGDERVRGTLLPGRLADLVVLDRDPVDDLDARVVATVVGGRWVHNPPPWD